MTWLKLKEHQFDAIRLNKDDITISNYFRNYPHRFKPKSELSEYQLAELREIALDYLKYDSPTVEEYYIRNNNDSWIVKIKGATGAYWISDTEDNFEGFFDYISDAIDAIRDEYGDI